MPPTTDAAYASDRSRASAWEAAEMARARDASRGLSLSFWVVAVVLALALATFFLTR